MDYATTFIFAREFERILIVLIAGAALWMGWQLFLRLQNQMEQQATFRFKDVSVQFQKVGPGIFFAFFGAALLGISFYRLPSIDFKPSDLSNKSGEVHVQLLGSGNQNEVERAIVALNIAITISYVEDPKEIPQAQLDNLKKAAGAVALVRNELLKRRFGDEPVKTWIKYRDDFRRGANVSAEFLPDVKKVDELASKLTLEP